MSNTKKYTAEEVARMIADRAAEIMKKHEISSEYMEQILEKSKNTAHEIDAGEEPNNDDAECPASLGGEGSSEKSESSEDASMEDEPLQGDNDSDTEEEETEEDEDEEDEDEYEFAKSEACGHTIEYKRLAKRCWEGYEPTPGKKAYTKGSCQKKSEDELSEKQKEKMDTDKDGDIDAEDLKNLRHAKKAEGNEVSEQEMQTQMPSRKTFPKASENNKEKKISEQEMQTQMPSRKTYKSESGMFTVEYKRLAKGVMATKEQLAAIRKPKSAANKPKTKLVDQMVEHAQQGKKTGIPLVDNQIADALGEKRMATQAERASVGLKPKQSESKQNSSVPKMAASEDSKVKETEGIEFDKKQDADKTKEEKKGVKRPLEKCGEIKKEEMDKCGEMSSGKKLKKFLGKMKKPSPGMIQEPQE